MPLLLLVCRPFSVALIKYVEQMKTEMANGIYVPVMLKFDSIGHLTLAYLSSPDVNQPEKPYNNCGAKVQRCTKRFFNTCCRFFPAQHHHPFRHKARSPQGRIYYFAAQPPNLRRLSLLNRENFLARSSCKKPSIRFLALGSQFRSTLPFLRLRFYSFTVINLRWGLHPQKCAK